MTRGDRPDAVARIAARIKELNEAADAAVKAGRLGDARHNFLRASEFLFARAAETANVKARAALEAEAAKFLVKARTINGAPAEAPQRIAAPPVAEADGRKRFVQAERPRVKFADIAGLADVKEEVRLKLLYPILHPEKAKRYRIKTGGGILLYGPPGTGKTLIAKAIAGEINAAFFTVKPSEIMSKWVGEAEQNVEALFRTARAERLSVIFIDEIEALVPRRRDSHSTVVQRLVPQILAELEGFDSAGKNPILFLGATNEPWSLDPAVLRPGRFDEKIYVGLPDLPARRKMLELYLVGRPADGLDLDRLAERLDGYSGADVRNICDKAAAQAFLGSIERGADAEIDEQLVARLLNEVQPSVRPADLQRFLKYAGGS